MYLTINSLIDINDIITDSNIILRKPYGYDKMYMNKDLMEDKIYQLTDQFSERKISHKGFI